MKGGAERPVYETARPFLLALAIGLLIYTLLLKVAVAIETGEMKMPDAASQGFSHASQAGH